MALVKYHLVCSCTFEGLLDIAEEEFEEIVCESEDKIGEYLLSRLNYGTPSDVDIDYVGEFELQEPENTEENN